MKVLADLNISPRTVDFLRALGHDVLRTSQVMPPNASDEQIVAYAEVHGQVILTQDLDFSDIIALSSRVQPSIITLRSRSHASTT